ncbi:MAG: GntR family transcriptional regulator [Clostridiales bacterium]
MDILITNNSQTPIYKQIVNQVKEAILKGVLSEGEQMPSMRKLAKDLQISLITTKHAYEELEKEGLIISMTGKGSFISSNNLEALKEVRLNEIEKHFEKGILLAKSINLTKDEVIEIFEIIFGEVNYD